MHKNEIYLVEALYAAQYNSDAVKMKPLSSNQKSERSDTHFNLSV
jgi:hypothetical protein